MYRKIVHHSELVVYQKAFCAAMEVFEVSKSFPHNERYSLTDQLRRASRSVCANIAWRKRRYKAAFVATLSDAETEVAETQVWPDFSLKCGYLCSAAAETRTRIYEELTRMLVTMIFRAEDWVLRDCNQMKLLAL